MGDEGRADAVAGPDAHPGPTRSARRGARRAVSGARSSLERRLDPTYRRLARTYRLADGSRRVYCYHIRKTAGTSLAFSFLALGGEDPLVVWRRMRENRLRRTRSGPYAFAVYRRDVLAEGAYFFGRSHRSYDDQPLPEETHTVTVLRDPVERVHSYFDYVAAADPLGLPGRGAGRERRWAHEGFDRFVDSIGEANLLTQLAVFSPRLDVSEAAERIAGCSSVLLTSDLQHGLDVLGRKLGLTLTEHRARVTAERTTLTEAQRERLRARLAPEYELLRRLTEEGVIPAGTSGARPSQERSTGS